MPEPILRHARAVACAMLAAGPLAAQEADLPPAVSVELNAAEAEGAGCLLSFVVQNGHPEAIDRVVYEAVLFDEDGRVAQLTLFDFGALPPARPRVRQFILPDMPCDGITRIIFNGAETCDSAALGTAACTDGLVLRSRTGAEVQG